MKIPIILIGMLVFSFISFSSPSFAQDGFSFYVENSKLDENDFVVITGILNTDFQDTGIGIQIHDKNGNLVDTVKPVKTNIDGNVEITFRLPAKVDVGEYNMNIYSEDEEVTISFSKSINLIIPSIDSIILESVQLKCQSLNIEEIDCLGITTNDIESAIKQINDYTKNEGGGCLIASATFGSELAPQVQMLREVRDNAVLRTNSGIAFMTAFNSFYYSFSPTVADWERQNSVFKETVKVTITPLLSSLTLLQLVDIDTEQEILGYGIGIILLNVGMYFVAPAIAAIKLKSVFRTNRVQNKTKQLWLR